MMTIYLYPDIVVAKNVNDMLCSFADFGEKELFASVSVSPEACTQFQLGIIKSGRLKNTELRRLWTEKDYCDYLDEHPEFFTKDPFGDLYKVRCYDFFKDLKDPDDIRKSSKEFCRRFLDHYNYGPSILAILGL